MASQVLSIIIVNFRSGQLIAECLDTLYRYNNLIELEVIVVDNSSSTSDKQLVTCAFPSVRWIDMGYNAGFARANNEGMRVASGDVFLLLNPDTICIDDSVQQCYFRIGQHPYAAAGVQLLDQLRYPQISGSFFVKGGLNHLLPIPYWGGLVRWLGYKAGSKVPGVQQVPGVQEVDWISGAFLMVRRKSVEDAGMMDADFFLYGEEVEWCSRLKRAGRLVLFGDLSIIHLEGATINQSQQIQEQGYYNLYDRKGLQLMVSNHLRVRKQYGIFWYLILLLNYTWGVPIFFLCSTFHQVGRLKSPLFQWRQAGRFGLNVLRLWRLAPLMIRNRPHFYKMF